MEYPIIKVRNARIEKHKNPFYDEPHYDYLLRLDEETFNIMREKGLPAKTIKSRFTEEPIYFIKVTPIWEFSLMNPYKKIPKPEDDDFLERDDIDITFKVYIKHDDLGRDFRKLYFSKSGIKENKK